MPQIKDNGISRTFSSKNYNTLFVRWKFRGGQLVPSGELLRWGKETKDDPDYSPYGPEIADIEISSGGCPGIINKEGKKIGCAFCYKGNKPGAPVENMSLDTYKKVFDKLNESGTLTQVALGLTGVEDNPDLLDIMRYTMDHGCFPNFTLTGADLDYDRATDLAGICGALAVSCSETNPDLCFDTVKLFTDLGVEQTNIHVVVSEQTIPFVHKVLDARINDSRLKNMGAIVCLMAKPKGRAVGKFNPPTPDQYQTLVHRILKEEIPAGFDSCSALRFMDAVKQADFLDETVKEKIYINSDPCESLCFSIYVNVKGEVFSCSFCEGEEGQESIDLLGAEDFIKDVWMSQTAIQFRRNLLSRKRSCPAFPTIDACLNK